MFVQNLQYKIIIYYLRLNLYYMEVLKMKNSFEWNRLGDIKTGRQNLGEDMPVIVYRLLQFTMMDVLTEKLGFEEAEEIFRMAGYEAGVAFAQNVIKKPDDFNSFVEKLQAELKNLKIGIMRVEKADLENLDFVITISEDLDCSGLPVTGETVCAYDEGFISGLFKHYTGRYFVVKEIDCWASGDRTCRFTAKVANK